MASAKDVEAEEFFSDGVNALSTEVAKLNLEIAGIRVEEHSVALCLEGHWLRCGPWLIIVMVIKVILGLRVAAVNA